MKSLVTMQQTSAAHARRSPSRSCGRCTLRRKLVFSVQAQRSTPDPSPEILTAFFFGRAFAITLNKRLSEAVIDFVSDVSKAMAEQPQRIAEFQEEVLALARKEMSTSGFLPENTSSGIASDVSIGRVATPGGSGVNPAAPLDPEAAIDELRSEIAYARASLNDIRAKQRTSSAQN